MVEVMPCVCPLTLVLVPWTGLRAEWGLVSPGVGGSGEGKRKGEMPGERRELAEKEAEEVALEAGGGPGSPVS